jgi:hypothetical protein
MFECELEIGEPARSFVLFKHAFNARVVLGVSALDVSRSGDAARVGLW